MCCVYLGSCTLKCCRVAAKSGWMARRRLAEILGATRAVRKIITIHSSAPHAALRVDHYDLAPHSISTSFKMAAVLNTISKLAVPLAFGAYFAQEAIYDVKGGTRAVIFDRLSGVKDEVVNEGTHFLIPWLQKSIIYDVRTKPRNISTTTGSKDLQMVSLTLRVLSRPDVKQLPKIYQVRYQM